MSLEFRTRELCALLLVLLVMTGSGWAESASASLPRFCRQGISQLSDSSLDAAIAGSKRKLNVIVSAIRSLQRELKFTRGLNRRRLKAKIGLYLAAKAAVRACLLRASNERRLRKRPKATPTSTTTATPTITATPISTIIATATPGSTGSPQPTPTASVSPTATPPASRRFASCSNGLDDDGDGFTDQNSFGCFGPNQSELPYSGSNYGTDSFGWTHVAPSPDTRIIYVSNSEGSDSNNGLSPAYPVKTLAHGEALLRHIYPDWLLLKRGDIWNESLSIQHSGRSATERLLIGSYGNSSARPLIKSGANNGISIQGGGGTPASSSNLAIIGLHLQANTRIPGSPDYTGVDGGSGFLYLRPGEHLLLEDMQIEYYVVNLSVQAEGDGLYDFVLRRSIVTDAYGVEGVSHSQGIYASQIHGGLIEENVFDHNGWLESGPAGTEATIFNHNLYISAYVPTTGMVVRRNIIARASSNGMQLRPGGDVVDNLFLKNSIAMFVGVSPSTIIGNVVLDAKDISPRVGEQRCMGIEVQPDTPSLLMQGNIVANAESTNYPYGFAYKVIGGGAVAQNISMIDNIAYNWLGAGLTLESDSVDSIQITRNVFESTRLGMSLISQSGALGAPVLSLAQNAYYAALPASQWFSINYISTSMLQWTSSTQEVGATSTQIVFPEPNRSMATYNTQIGGEGTLEAFLVQTRTQTKSTWRTDLTADAAIAYIRAGFGR
ncbi:MAG: hypothetical protein K1X79_08930 [Oligoflexia bacterium]|nr:hypothetical protein [Oligoflexia bacterium]